MTAVLEGDEWSAAHPNRNFPPGKTRYPLHRSADKSLARPTSLSIVFSVHGIGGSPTGPDPENRVGDQDTGSPGRPISSGLQVPGETFPSWSG
jgi:hypothetical protein